MILGPAKNHFLDLDEKESKITRHYFAKKFGKNLDLIELQELFTHTIDLGDTHSKSRIFRAHTREISFIIKISAGEPDNETRCMQIIEKECIWPAYTAPVFGIAWYELVVVPTKEERKKCSWIPSSKKISIKFLESYEITMCQYSVRYMTGMDTEIIRSISALVIHGFYYLDRILPGFLHGDMHLNNIMIQNFVGWVSHHDIPEYIQLSIPGITLYVPFFGMMPRIIDYDFASYEKLGIHPSDKKNHPASIAGSDVMRFVYSLFHVSPISVKAFVRSMGTWTRHFEETNEKTIRQSIQPVPSAADCLASPAFADYRVVPQTGVIIRRYGSDTI